MNKALFGAALAAVAVLSVGMMTGQAFAQYMGNVDETGKTGKNTLEETLKLARDRVEYAADNPATGSGTPYLAADGVLGASAIAAAIFGGIAGAFFFKGRSGRYAAQGRG
jgi:F0F1-type ATP synthase membrane subunit c/vacuolar-type H+-ATPase subunit K